MSDYIDDCLTQWIDRARGMHTPTWMEWMDATAIVLQVYRVRQARRAEAIKLVEDTQLALLDHNLETIESNLEALKGLL